MIIKTTEPNHRPIPRQSQPRCLQGSQPAPSLRASAKDGAPRPAAPVPALGTPAAQTPTDRPTYAGPHNVTARRRYKIIFPNNGFLNTAVCSLPMGITAFTAPPPPPPPSGAGHRARPGRTETRPYSAGAQFTGDPPQLCPGVNRPDRPVRGGGESRGRRESASE